MESSMLPQSSRLQFAPDLEICRILNGMWQVSGAHGYVEPEQAVTERFRYHEVGFTTWDHADQYRLAQGFMAEFRSPIEARDGRARLADLRAIIKSVPY